MPEERLLTVGVECYAGHRGEQTPRTLILGDHRIFVAEVLDAWLAPDYRYFKLKGADVTRISSATMSDPTPGSSRCSEQSAFAMIGWAAWEEGEGHT
jgi:hypothetical protein